MRKLSQSSFACIVFVSALPSVSPAANSFVRHNLVSDIAGIADQTDPNLVNPWGIAFSATSPFWISNNRTGTATVYDSGGKSFPPANPLIVRIAPPPSVDPPAAPTGQVFNDTSTFNIVTGKPAMFLFASENGTISGWNGSVDGGNAILIIDNSGSGAVYKGMALAANGAGPLLYAANFHAGTIDVFDGAFSPVALAGSFTDPNLPGGFAPFNIQRIGRKLYVTYAQQDQAKHDDVAGAGNGFLNVFDTDGNFLQRLLSNGRLNSPWGLALAPDNFGDFSHSLLVGNFGDGFINAYDPCSGEYMGTLQDSTGAPISIPGLWALTFGNGHNGGDAHTAYFTAGIPGNNSLEDHGLFGSIQPWTAAPPVQPPSDGGAAQPSAAPPIAIKLAGFQFMPQSVTAANGARVSWTNKDGTAHTVTADKGQFSSDELSRNDTFAFSFTAPGTYSYHCSTHPFMKGTIVLK